MTKKVLWIAMVLVLVVSMIGCAPVVQEESAPSSTTTPTPTPTVSPSQEPEQPQETPQEEPLEIEGYLREDPEPLVSLLGMEKAAEPWQFGDQANSYEQGGLAIEWMDPEDNYDLYAVSAQGIGDDSVSICGVACGKTYEQVDQPLLESGWIVRHAEEDGAGYLKFEEDASFSLEIQFGAEDHVITQWYWNNWPEGEDVADFYDQQNGGSSGNYTAYTSVLQQVEEEYRDSYSEYLRYHLFDMDADGAKELIVLEGTCEADYMWKIYTLKEGQPTYMAEFSGFHSTLYADEEGQLFNLMAQMGVENITQISLKDGEIVEKTVLEKEFTDDDFVYPSGSELPWAYIGDYSLLEE